MNIAPVHDVLDRIGARAALIGAHAMAVRGYARFTADIDLLTTDRRVLEPAAWSDLAATGASVDARRGDADDPLAVAGEVDQRARRRILKQSTKHEVSTKEGRKKTYGECGRDGP